MAGGWAQAPHGLSDGQWHEGRGAFTENRKSERNLRDKLRKVEQKQALNAETEDCIVLYYV